VWGNRVRKGWVDQAREGTVGREKLSAGRGAEGEPERSESSREHEVPVRAKHLGSEKGHGFLSGRKPLKRGSEVVRFCFQAQERRGFLERGIRPLKRRKALKSEAQERWGLKETSKG